MRRIHSVAIRIFVSRKQARRVQTPNASIGVIWRQYLLPAFTNAKLFRWRYLALTSTQQCGSAHLNYHYHYNSTSYGEHTLRKK